MGVIKFFFDIMMACIPSLMFMPQLIKMKKEMNASGYSKVVSLLIIIAHVLRLCFRLGVKFSTALIIQSIFQISLQTYALYEILKIQAKCDPVLSISQRQNTWIKKYLGDFWDWNEFKNYGIAIASICAGTFTFSLAMIPFHWYFELLGLISISIEAILSLPQYLKNRREHSVEGLSVLVVCCWTCGDIFKLTYHITTRQPIHFCCCSFSQLVIDSSVLYQFLLYSQKSFWELVTSNINTLRDAIPMNYLPVSIPPVGLDGECVKCETPEPYNTKTDTDVDDTGDEGNTF